MNYVLNEALKQKKYSEPDLFAPGEPCKCKCSDDCGKARCKDCREISKDCKICTKNEAYEMLTTGMIGGPSIVFCRSQKFISISLTRLADLSNGFQKKFQVQEEPLTTIKTKSNSVIQLN